MQEDTKNSKSILLYGAVIAQVLVGGLVTLLLYTVQGTGDFGGISIFIFWVFWLVFFGLFFVFARTKKAFLVAFGYVFWITSMTMMVLAILHLMHPHAGLPAPFFVTYDCGSVGQKNTCNSLPLVALHGMHNSINYK